MRPCRAGRRPLGGAENLVIFFRDQHLSDEQHLAFGRLFGDLHLHPATASRS